MNIGSSLTKETWQILRALPLSEIKAQLSSQKGPSRLSAEFDCVSWSAHPKMSCFDERPSSMLISSAWLPNGHSATLVYGCEPSLMSWGEAEEGPWPMMLGLAARQGDEARGSTLACFEPGSSPPRLAPSSLSFTEEGPDLDMGSLTAVVESASVEEVARALRLLASLEPAWDDPVQGPLWSLARSGRALDLGRALAESPEWARKAWSKGSSLAALCARLGQWESAAEVAKAGSGRFSMELRAECSRAVADFCQDIAPGLALGAAPKALALAWRAGLELDEQAWVWAGLLGHALWTVEEASAAWRRGEALWLGEQSGASGREGSPRRL